MATAQDVLDRAEKLVENGNIDTAKKYYQAVVDRMPNSAEAKIAQEKLDELNKPAEPDFDDLFADNTETANADGSVDNGNASEAQGLPGGDDGWQSTESTPEENYNWASSSDDSQNVTAEDEQPKKKKFGRSKKAKKEKKAKAPKAKKPIYKKWWFWVIIVVVLVIIIASASGGSSSSSSSSGKAIESSEINDLFKNADDYQGRSFTFTGKVFNVGDDDDYFQVWYDIENSKKDVYVECTSEMKADLKEDDYVRVESTVDGKETGTNILGGSVDVVKVTAKSVEKIDVTEAIAAVKSVDVNQTVTQGTVTATVTKVDFTESGYLRIYVTVQNNGGATADVYPDQGNIVQNGSQIEAEYSLEDYPQVSSELAAGASSSGVVLFKTSDQSSFTYSFTGYDSNYNELTFSYNIEIS